ncbi:Cuticle protein 6 [Penaeus vannamei]|uniref:Cuticle protein 6 n=1 Tax=Penaeus vannamei TaxID=6689 RepID=A0A423TMA2_PENVA|nr:Cuticle protein 6 [Penaeus vannamei]
MMQRQYVLGPSTLTPESRSALHAQRRSSRTGDTPNTGTPPQCRSEEDERRGKEEEGMRGRSTNMAGRREERMEGVKIVGPSSVSEVLPLGEALELAPVPRGVLRRPPLSRFSPRQVLLLSVSCVCWSKPTTVVNFSPVGYSPGIAPGFAYAFRATAPLYAPVAAPAGAQAVAQAVAAPAPTIVKTQYHSQDELGQYAFGYVGDASTAHEVRTLDGAVRGSYTYVDADGKLQTATYVADKNGFRVEATNLPVSPSAATKSALPLPEPVQPTPEVQAATAAHLQAVAEVKAARARRSAPAQGYLPPPAPAAKKETEAAPLPVKKVVKVHAAPVPSVVHAHAAPAVISPVVHAHAAPLVPVPAVHTEGAPLAVFVRADPEVLQRVVEVPLAARRTPRRGAPYCRLDVVLSQFHSQNELGGYEYGYEGGPSAKHEVRTPDGVTRGSYSYVDANGELQTVSYVADDLHGFRVLASNLPEGPAKEH